MSTKFTFCIYTELLWKIWPRELKKLETISKLYTKLSLL